MHILITEDKAGLGSPLQYLLQRNGHQTHVISVYTEPAARVWARPFDAVIVHTNFPEELGVPLVHGLREARVDHPLMVLSRVKEVAAKVHLLDQGADKYVTRPVRERELLWWILALVRRCQVPVDEDQVTIGELRVDFKRDRQYLPEGELRLTSFERRLLQAFVRTPGQVIPVPVLAVKMRGSSLDIAESRNHPDHLSDDGSNTVEAIVRRVRVALQAMHCFNPWIRTVRRQGYILETR